MKPTRVIVHAGFHKTGTTSLQVFVDTNRDRLSRYASIYMQNELKHARYLGRWYGQFPMFVTRMMFRFGFANFLNSIPDSPVIFISRESFSGMMLGAKGLRFKRMTEYSSTAIPLAKDIVAGLKKRFGSKVRIEFLYTTREGEAFLQSIYGHVLRTSALKEDWSTFRARFRSAPELSDEVRKIAEAIAPVPVHEQALESVIGHRLGPGAIVLNLLGVPEESWKQFPDAVFSNSGQPAPTRETFLQMNRKGGHRASLKAAKQKLASRERRKNG